MPSNETSLTVFVASPSDVKDERDSLEDVIRELNITWSKALGIRLDLIRWETHSYPAFGQDAQDVINKQIPNDYDIFIGILWAKFGTPTNRADSGTEEEFEHAYQRYEEYPKNISLMFYFKDEPISPSQIDPKQISKINSFKKKLGVKGGFYWTFNSITHFQSLMRIHLSRIVQSWAQRLKVTTKVIELNVLNEFTAPEALTKENQIEKDSETEVSFDKEVRSSDLIDFTKGLKTEVSFDEELGFPDLICSATDSFNKTGQITIRLSSILKDLTIKTNQRRKEFSALRRPHGQIDMVVARRIATKASEDMMEYVRRTKVEIPIFAENLQNAIKSFGMATSVSTDFNTEDISHIENARQTISTLKSQMEKSCNSLIGFKQAVNALPRLTKTFNKAKWNTEKTVDSLILEITIAVNLADEVEKSITQLIYEN